MKPLFPVGCTVLTAARLAQLDKRPSAGMLGDEAPAGPILR